MNGQTRIAYILTIGGNHKKEEREKNSVATNMQHCRIVVADVVRKRFLFIVRIVIRNLEKVLLYYFCLTDKTEVGNTSRIAINFAELLVSSK